MDQPGVIRALWSISKVLLTIKRPVFEGNETVDHSEFAVTLKGLEASDGVDLADHADSLLVYTTKLGDVDPAGLSRHEALAFWINLYNAGALLLAAEAQRKGSETVLRIPGAFSRPYIAITGETLSLDAIEHAKIRRFKDPRIHSALVCGSVSCPTLRSEPYTGTELNGQLDRQMQSFLANGASRMRSDGTLELSRVFLWYGSDFVRPGRMPTLMPSARDKIVMALEPWLGHPASAVTSIEFQSYDWGLRCSLGAS